MVRKVLYPAVFVLMVLMAAPAVAAWDLVMVESADPLIYGLDGRFYESDMTTLVQTGALVQFIVALEGSAIVDPLEHFDYDTSGDIQWGTLEYDDMVAWLNAGADPAAISGGLNVLATASNFTGEVGLVAPGYVLVDAYAETNSPYSIVPGATFDKIAYRSWSLTKEEMDTFCTRPLEEIWYLTGRELSSHSNVGGGPDTGWWIGMPGFDGGGAPAPEDWTGLNSLIGWEVMYGLRAQYTLDTLLGVCIPEPGTMLLIGGSVVLLLIRRKK